MLVQGKSRLKQIDWEKKIEERGKQYGKPGKFRSDYKRVF